MVIYIGVINNLNIIDAHCHISVNGNFNQNLDQLKVDMKKNGINKAILFIDPFVKEFTCPKESKDNFHYCHISDKSQDLSKLSIFCDKCEKHIYYGDDPYDKYNKKLFEEVNDSMFYLFLMLSISNNTINNNIDKFKYLHGYKICGLKLYTGLTDVTLNNLKNLNSHLPLLIHTGKAFNQDPKNMIKFLKSYKGYIILAHYARFCPEVVELVKAYDNIYVDTSPSAYIYKEYINRVKKRGLFDYKGIDKPEDLYYKALELFGIDKLIFGSDYPFSSLDNEVELLKRVKLTETEFDKITNKNITKILRRN